MLTKKCETCACRQNDTCALLQCQVTTEQAACPNHTEVLGQCALCKSAILPKTAIIENSSSKTICADCVKILNTCACCSFGKSCAFETDPSPLPKIVQKEIRKGNAIMITQVRNPERIKITCKNCKCYSKEFEDCNKTFNYCENFNDGIGLYS